MNDGKPGTKKISALCVVLVGVILTAGLWPFHAPRNAVTWLQNENGLRFHGDGFAVSAAPFRAHRPLNATGWSLEILLRPEQSTGGGSILAFDSSPEPWAPFLLRQYGASLAVQRYLVDDSGHVSQPWFQVKDVFIAHKSVLITITSERSSTALYVNGVLAGTSPDPGIATREFTGPLLLGNSTFDDSWIGQIGGLAIYDRELTPIQVSDNTQRWMRNPDRLTMKQQSPVALYLFDERSGSTVHNLLDPATSLTIPASYFVLHPEFLRSTWDEYSHANAFWKRWGFWKGLGLNIGGFMPVGFAFFAYFSSVRRIGHPVLASVLLGFFLSFTVETLQRFLPTRDSGMTDLFTNTAGTALGVLLYRSSALQVIWTKFLDLGNYSDRNTSPAQGEKQALSRE